MNRADRRKTAKTNHERIDEYNEAGRQLLTPGGDLKQAQRLFRQVLAIDPGDAPANLHLGVMEMWTRNYKKAQELFARALEREPANAQILNNLGLALHEQGGIAESMPIYQKALEIDPNNTEARVNYARALLHVNQRDQALAEARQAVAQRPEFGTAQFILGSICQVMGNVEEATTALKKAVEIMPGHTEACFRLARLTYDPQNPDAYLDPIKASYQANADNVDAAVTWSEILFGARQFAEAEEVLHKHEETAHPQSRLGVTNGLAHAKACQGDYAGAIDYHKKALTITVDDPNTRYFYGRSLLRSGDHKAAGEQFMKAVSGLPFHQDLIGMLMLTQKLQGQTDAVKAEVNTLIHEMPLQTKEAYGSIEELNKAVMTKLADVDQRPVHPFDQNRRLGDTAWEAALGMQNLEPIVALGEMLQELMTGYVADMPDGVRNHPMLARKDFGLGSSGSHAETINNFEDFSYAVDQQGWFRIVYFLSVPEEVADEEKKAGWLRFGVPHFEMTPAATPDREIKPVAGTAVIFPAYLWFGFNALAAKEGLSFISVQVNASVG